MRLAALAPAKVNLFLHVGRLEPDGYHPVASLMAFADVGDRLTLELAPARSLRNLLDRGAGDAPADPPESSLSIGGPFAGALEQEDWRTNLVWRAVQRFLRGHGGPFSRFRLVLDKQLPVAAGLGGGSSDAGAALRLLREAFSPAMQDDMLELQARELGADGPACLHARPVLGLGRGDELAPAPTLPSLPAVLVNPGVACPTGQVYRAYDAGPARAADVPDLPRAFGSVEALAAALATCRNDLEPPAMTVAPEVGAVLARLRRSPRALLARLSGSGATAFALCASEREAGALAAELQAEEPRWWVRACRLGAPETAPQPVHDPVKVET